MLVCWYARADAWEQAADWELFLSVVPAGLGSLSESIVLWMDIVPLLGIMLAVHDFEGFVSSLCAKHSYTGSTFALVRISARPSVRRRHVHCHYLSSQLA